MRFTKKGLPCPTKRWHLKVKCDICDKTFTAIKIIYNREKDCFELKESL